MQAVAHGYAIRRHRGEELIASLRAFMHAYDIGVGALTGRGARVEN